jgi:putative DNA primase/helicase
VGIVTDVLSLVGKRKKLNAKHPLASASQETPAVGERDDFQCLDDGVYYWQLNRDGERQQVRICAKLEVTARCRDFDGNGWGYVLAFCDPRGHAKQWVLPSRLLAGDGTEFRAALMEMGLQVSGKVSARGRLSEYVQTRKPSAFFHTANRIGWQPDGAFVLPDRTIGESEERIIFQSDGAAPNTFKQQHDVAVWRDSIARRCVGNSRLVFAVSLAFAGPLLKPVGVDSGGFHFRGDSSTGKTAAFHAAASVWGHGKDFMQKWKTTDNALETTAAQHCDVTLILDEIGELEAAKAGDCAYMLANGSGKARAKQNGSARARLSWRLLFLSSGEISLSDLAAESGKRVQAGQEVRMVDIPTDVGCGLGVFETLYERDSDGEWAAFIPHGLDTAKRDGAAFADAIMADAMKHYGAAGIAFLEKLTSDSDAIAERSKRAVATLTGEWARAALSGQVARVARRFALVAVAGELATEFGITGWLPQEATICTKVMFDAWIEARGGTGDGERTRMLNQVRAFFEAHGSSRFTYWHRATDDHAPNTMYRAGFKRVVDDHGKPLSDPVGDISKDAFADGQIEYYVLPSVFRDEVCKGYDYKAVCRLLIELGHLMPDSKGRFTRTERLPTMGNASCFRIRSSIFDHGEA